MANVTVYTQSQSDTLLSAKANQSDLTTVQQNLTSVQSSVQTNKAAIDSKITPAGALALLNAYDASRTGSGAVTGTATIDASGGGTLAVDLGGDTTVTLNASNGVSLLIDVLTNGHKLIITNGPTITTDGLYAVSMSRGVWKGGAAGAAASTGTTGSTTTTPTSTDTEVGSIDFTTLADGAESAGLKLSNGTSLTLTNFGVKSGALVNTASSNWAGAYCTIPVSLVRIKIVVNYDMSNADHSAQFKIAVGENGSIQNSCGFFLTAAGVVNAGNDGSQCRWTFNIDSGAYVAPKGTATLIYNSATGKGTLLVNGTQVGTFVPDTTQTPTVDLTKRAGGVLLFANGPSAATDVIFTKLDVLLPSVTP